MKLVAVLTLSASFQNINGFTPLRNINEATPQQKQKPASVRRSGASMMDRPAFLHKIFTLGTTTATTTIALPTPIRAIDFVPASPYFSGTYQDAAEIIYTQRLAVDNIVTVIRDGNVEEAGFKVMQLSAQTRMASKIVLDTFQEQMSGKVGMMKGESEDGIILLRFLSCQKKFAILLDLCDDCGVSLQNAIKKGKVGATAAGQLKSLSVVEETRLAYDDFLMDFEKVQTALGEKLKP